MDASFCKNSIRLSPWDEPVLGRRLLCTSEARKVKLSYNVHYADLFGFVSEVWYCNVPWGLNFHGIGAFGLEHSFLCKRAPWGLLGFSFVFWKSWHQLDQPPSGAGVQAKNKKTTTLCHFQSPQWSSSWPLPAAAPTHTEQPSLWRMRTQPLSFRLYVRCFEKWSLSKSKWFDSTQI